MSAAATAAGYLYAAGKLRAGRGRKEMLQALADGYRRRRNISPEEARELAEAELKLMDAKRARRA